MINPKQNKQSLRLSTKEQQVVQYWGMFVFSNSHMIFEDEQGALAQSQASHLPRAGRSSGNAREEGA